jgi:hypothetical protein
MLAGPDKSREDPQWHEKQQLQEQPPKASEQDVRLVIFRSKLFHNQRAARIDEKLIHHTSNHPAKQGIRMICLSKKLRDMLNSRQIRLLYVRMAILHKTQER